MTARRVVKGSMIAKMPDDEWQQFANLRLLYGFQFGHPGKKLQFMGGEFGQRREWNHDKALDWQLLHEPLSAGLCRWVRDLNRLYAAEPSLHAHDPDSAGFEWIDCNDHARSMVSFIRRGGAGTLLFVCNFTPVPRLDELIGVPAAGYWREVLNSDARDYGGSGVGNSGGVTAEAEPQHGRPYRRRVAAPPLGVVVFRSPGDRP